ncbi:MAG: NGG1p interacting factor NIF3 [Oceanobacter sp.]
MYKLVFFVPSEHKEVVKAEVFAANAGHIGRYAECCWEIEGKGQFRPLQGSNPAIGGQGELSYVDEFRVEMVCEKRFIREVIAALKAAHPYEEPAYEVMELLEF